MTDDSWVLDALAADAIGHKIMKVASAQPGHRGPEQDIILGPERRLEHIADLNGPDSGQNGGFHEGLLLGLIQGSIIQEMAPPR
jgi:hypothetical protein